MFDIGFAELMLLGVVGLLVLGPERLPVAVRTVSIYIGKLRRSFNSVRNEIERELHTEEIKQELHNQAVLDSLKETEQQLREGLETPYDISDISGKKDADSNDTPPAT